MFSLIDENCKSWLKMKCVNYLLRVTRKGFLEKDKCPPQLPPPPSAPKPPPTPPVIILVDDMSSHPALHFYQVSSKYCDGYSSYRADTKSNSNTRRGDKSKSINFFLTKFKFQSAGVTLKIKSRSPKSNKIIKEDNRKNKKFP